MSGTVSNCQRKMRDEGDGRKPSGPAAGLHVMWAGAEIRESSAKWATSILKAGVDRGGVYFEVRDDFYSAHLPGRRCPSIATGG